MYFHSQNLRKEEKKKHLIHWRCWWKLTDSTELTFAISIPSSFWHIHLELCENGWQEEAIGLDIACPLFAIWTGFENRWLYSQLEKLTRRKGQKYTGGRVIGISFHSGTFWFSLWETPMESSSSDPKWWRFTFNPMDFFFGRTKHTEEVLQEGDTSIDMPEGKYDATYKRFVSYWKRPRWPFTDKIHRISLEIPVGIPHEGKGENSWDCGMDATFGSTFPAPEHESLHEIVERFSIRELEQRQKYGSLSSPDYEKWRTEHMKKLSV